MPRDGIGGATGHGRNQSHPGDELVEGANEQTQAVTIDALPAAVWAWLVEMAPGRADFYSYAPNSSLT